MGLNQGKFQVHYSMIGEDLRGFCNHTHHITSVASYIRSTTKNDPRSQGQRASACEPSLQFCSWRQNLSSSTVHLPLTPEQATKHALRPDALCRTNESQRQISGHFGQSNPFDEGLCTQDKRKRKLSVSQEEFENLTPFFP